MKTDTVSERDFAQLDHFMWEKPNASTIALEGMILFANNKTTAWLQSKMQEERKAITDLARQSADKLKKKFQERAKGYPGLPCSGALSERKTAEG